MPESMPFNRILLAINVRWWNAEAAYAINLARGLVNRGLKVWIIVNSGSPVHHKAEKHGLQTITDIYLDSRSLVVQYKNLKKLLRVIDQHNIELINSFKSNGAILFSIARRYRPGLTYIKTRGIASPPKNHFINRYLYGKRSCDGIITVGSPVYNWMRDLLGYNSPQLIKTVYYGDSAVIDAKTRDVQLIEPVLAFPENKRLFALVGRIQQVKGHMLLLQALQQLKQLAIHILFLVKDLEEFPDVLKEIHDYIKINQLTDKVSILGFQKDLGKHLNRVHCGVIPSLASEVNCRVCVEFFSAGIPVVAFPTGTLSDIVSHLENGYLCSEKSVLELVKGISWALEDDLAFKRAKQCALDDYHKKYTLEKLAEDTVSFYQQCKNV
jgi:glycosyltransferase involved in cell wall biosynthesis